MMMMCCCCNCIIIIISSSSSSRQQQVQQQVLQFVLMHPQHEQQVNQPAQRQCPGEQSREAAGALLEEGIRPPDAISHLHHHHHLRQQQQ